MSSLLLPAAGARGLFSAGGSTFFSLVPIWICWSRSARPEAITGLAAEGGAGLVVLLLRGPGGGGGGGGGGGPPVVGTELLDGGGGGGGGGGG